MSELPPGWEWTRLDDVAEVRLGRQRSPKNHTGSQMRPYLRAANVGWQGLRLDDVKTMNFTDEEAKIYRLKYGDIVVAEASGSPGEVGKPALWRDEIEGCCLQNTLIRVRSLGAIEPSYLLHLIRGEALRGAFAEKSRGVGIHHLGSARLAEWPIPVPPLAEQRSIVASLEVHHSHLDVGTEILRLIRHKLSELKKLLLARTFDLDDARSRGWPIRRLGEVVLVASGNTPRGLSEHLGAEMDSSVPFYKVGDMNISEGRTLLSSRTYLPSDSASQLGIRVRPAGTVLIPKRGGSIATNKKRIMGTSGAYDLNIMGLVPIGELHASYLWWWLQRLDLTSIADGSNVPQINHPDLTELLIPVPTGAAQEEISAALDDQLDGVLDNSLAWADRRALILRRSLLGEAFAGRLVPQDLNDEPASALLERIKPGRTAQPKPKRGRRVTKNVDQGSLL